MWKIQNNFHIFAYIFSTNRNIIYLPKKENAKIIHEKTKSHSRCLHDNLTHLKNFHVIGSDKLEDKIIQGKILKNLDNPYL